MKSEDKKLIIHILPLDKEMTAGEIPSYSEQLRLKKAKLEKKLGNPDFKLIKFEKQRKLEDSADSYSSETFKDEISKRI